MQVGRFKAQDGAASLAVRGRCRFAGGKANVTLQFRGALSDPDLAELQIRPRGR